MNKKMITGIGGAIILIVALGLVVGLGSKKRAGARDEAAAKVNFNHEPRPVMFEQVQAASDDNERSFPGIVRASEETALSFRVGGPLTEVHVKQGEPVRQGDVLMKIDPRDFEDRIQSLEAQLSGAIAFQKNAQQDFSRVSNLFKEKVVSQSDFDRARCSLDSAEASVKGITAQLQIVKHSLKDTELLAPYDGTVTEQLVENHEMISPGEVVLRYHNIQRLEVTVSVPASEIIQREMIPGAPVQVSFPEIRGKTLDARLKEWSSLADKLTRSYAVTFEFEAPEEFKILPGMSASISWNDARTGAAELTIPVSALCPSDDGGSHVWIYDEASGAAERRKVEPGELKGASRVVVRSGLAEGEKVVVSGSRLVHKGLVLQSAAIR